MSGSGGGGGSNYDPRPKPVPTPGKGGGSGGGDGVGGADPCAIEEIAALNSPNPAVVRTLRIGDVLDVIFQSGPPQVLIARNAAGQTAGSITSPS